MKSCEFIKGTLGLANYDDKDVFADYPMIFIEGRNYVTDKTAERIYKHTDKIKFHVISNCIPLKG